LTPRAVAALRTLGMTDYLDDRPRIRGLRMRGWGRVQDVPWPQSSFGPFGSAVARQTFDDDVRRFAVGRGAHMVVGAKAVDVERDSAGRVIRVRVQRGDEQTTIRVGELIVADGVKSTLGKALGRQWHRDTAYGVAARSYAASELSGSEWLGSDLELRGPDGTLLPGYGWVFPLGDGTVNLGVGALATAKRPASLQLKPVLEHYARAVADQWQLTAPPQRIASALLPMGGAVSGVAGPNWMLIGDAAACVNPLNGEGIDYALETGRMSVDLLDESHDHTRAWPAILQHEYGVTFAAARRAAGLLTMPKTVPVLGRPGIRSAALMDVVVRVMGNLLTPEDSDFIARSWRTVGAGFGRFEARPPFS
ncbi:MAG: FAD-linked oxidoreductase, partial [Gordonia sp. (in: high G+C Gram-positive bacteria)]|uniref:FAD-linked oxidoreductase n=1 Tax=Gordonia sp. (in: high G+C Gram-positive bacteria) TaxID=84139 RepID=UPI003BB5CDBC